MVWVSQGGERIEIFEGVRNTHTNDDMCLYGLFVCVCGEWGTYVSSFSAIVVSVEVGCGGGVPGPFLVVVLTAQCMLCMY